MKRDVEFLFEIGALRLIPRQWQRFHLPFVANLTEHHYRVMWLALLIAAREKKGNTEKIMKMALVHDIAESRTGDVDYLARQYVDRHERKALEHMLDKTPFKKEFLEIFDEYEARKTIEAKIVKDADYLDVDLDLMEQGDTGHSLQKHWTKQRNEVGKKLFTKAAQQLQKEIRSANPHDWHIKSPYNRLNGGDWSKK
jgi:putative hydrolase of HD superfamily